MDEISQEVKEEIVKIVSSQKKAKLDWVSTITKIPIETIISNAEDMGLIIENEFISLPTGIEESSSDNEERAYSSIQPKANLKTRTRGDRGSRLAVILMFIGAVFSLLFGIVMIGLQACVWFTAIGVILLVLSLGLGIGAYIILKRR